MALDLDRVRREIQASPLLSPYPVELSIAIVNDCFRTAGCAPIDDDRWEHWLAKPHALYREQLSMLGYLLSVTSLREETIPLLPKAAEPATAVETFFRRVLPLTAEMIRANRFRQEEFVRRWLDAWGGTVAGETPEESRTRLGQMDYRKTLKEFAAAEASRKAEAERRAALLREAAEREAAARGWRE